MVTWGLQNPQSIKRKLKSCQLVSAPVRACIDAIDRFVRRGPQLSGRVVKKPSRILQPGMVVTIEPGLYVRPAEGVPERYWHIGIRIEDDALVTSGGCELLTREVPVAADEIEALMRESIGN